MAIKSSVLFLIDSLNCGGAEKSLVSLLPLLDYTKIDVDLMMVHRGGSLRNTYHNRSILLISPVLKGFIGKFVY